MTQQSAAVTVGSASTFVSWLLLERVAETIVITIVGTVTAWVVTEIIKWAKSKLNKNG